MNEMRPCRLLVFACLLLSVPAHARAAAGPPVRLQSGNLPIEVTAQDLEQQFAALSAMPGVVVEYSELGPVRSVQGDLGVTLPPEVRALKEGESADALLRAFRGPLLATGRETLMVTVNRDASGSRRLIRTEEHVRGIPVYYGGVSVGFDAATGRVTSLTASFLPDRGLPREPRLSPAQALEAAVRAFEASGDAVPGTVREGPPPSLIYYGVQPDSTGPKLTWQVSISFKCPTGRGDSQDVWVDAVSGRVVASSSPVVYIQSPGPCRLEPEPDCEAEPDPTLGDAPYGSSCSAGTSTRPRLVVTRVGCTNRFRVAWPRIPGAAQYHVIGAPKDLGWAFAQTIGAGFVHQCTTQVDRPTEVKMRSCDGCGCGEWSEVLTLDPQAPCAH